MKTNQSSKTIVAGLFAAALLFAQLTAQGAIVGPYPTGGTAAGQDPNTLHLYHCNATSGTVGDDVAAGIVSMTKSGFGLTYAADSYDTSFGKAISTLDGGQNGTTGTGKDAFLMAANTAVTPVLADSTTGAFTMEAMIQIKFNPALNMNTTANGGNGRNSACEIVCGDSTPDGTSRVFQFRMSPLGLNGGTAVTLDFVNLYPSVQTISVPVPTTGPDAIVSNSWYHVAVAYNGSANTAGNLTFYWTLMDPSRTNAIVLDSRQMTSGLRVGAPFFLAIGNICGRSATNANFLGSIDEVRISSIARAADGMRFTPAPPSITSQPTGQTVGVGQGAGFSVTASGLPVVYQWRLYGTNLPEATQSTYSIAAAQLTDDGPYDVVITNNYGATNSDVATLTVRTPLNLTWLGSAGSAWNTTDVDWVTDTSANVAYSPGDNVTFDNSGSAVSSVSLSGPLNPKAVVVNAGNDYTFTTSVGGGIVGSTGLTKSGAGRLVLDTDNSYTGSTLIQGGIVQLGEGGSSGSLGTGPITNDAAIVVNRTGTASFNNMLAGAGSLTNLAGTVSIGGTNTLSGPIVINAGGALSLVGPQAGGNSASFILNAPSSVTVSGNVTIGSNPTLYLLGTTASPDVRCSLNTGSDSSTNILNGPIVVGSSGTIPFLTANSELDINGSVSGPAFTGSVLLRGTTGVGHVYGAVNLPSGAVNKTDSGLWIIHSTGNSWVSSSVASGTLRLAANNALPTGVTLAVAAKLDLAGFNQQIAAFTGTGTGTITNSSTTSDSTLTVNPAAPSVFFGAIKDSAAGGTGKVGLTLAGGTLTLQGTNTFTGDATISAGTLALSQMGSLNSTAGSIIIAAGATFDVSAVTSPPANVRTGKTLSAGGVAGGATINGALVLNGDSFLTLIYVSGTPAINVTGGELTLTANPTTVTVSGAALGVGSYKLIAAGTGGSVAGTLPGSVTVGGSGLAADTTASLRITSGELWLDVASTGAPQQPVVTGFSYDSASSSLILSGTNGIEGNTYYVLASTNVAAPLADWQPVSTNVFQAGGVFSVTNPVSSAMPARFYRLQLP